MSASSSSPMLLFYGHDFKKYGLKAAMSNFWMCSFVDPTTNLTFMCSEQYMMYSKAILFHDDETAREIMMAETPFACKRLGRLVKRFDQQVWSQECENIVLRACLLKFHQSPRLREFLLSTGESMLAEASANDSIWGIGLAASSPLAKNPATWKGTNLLGKVLMRTRTALRTIDSTAAPAAASLSASAAATAANTVSDAGAGTSDGTSAHAGADAGAADSGVSGEMTEPMSTNAADVVMARSLGVISCSQDSLEVTSNPAPKKKTRKRGKKTTNGGSGGEAKAAATADEPDMVKVEDPVKVLKKLNKLMRQIDDLCAAQVKGEILSAEQITKVERKAELEAEIAKLSEVA